MTHGGVKNMRVSFNWRLGAFAAAAVSTVAFSWFTSAVASAWWHPPGPPTSYVNGSTISGYGHSACSYARYTTISSAVAAATPGTHIVVCPGTYDEGVQIDKPLVLSGIDAVIDAGTSSFGNGVQIVGPGGSGTTVEGFKIEKAEFEGILVGTAPVAPGTTDGSPVTEGSPVSHVTIADNVLIDNGTGFGTDAGQCFSTPEAPGDCGETIHLVAATDSIVEGNYVANNVGGILLTDEFGPTSHDIVRYNQALNNTDDCGITLAGHSSAAVDPVTGSPTGVAGVFDNLIERNVSSGNGVAGQGAGILLGGGAPFAGVYDNTIRGNLAKGNGLPGVTIHQHLAGDLNGNVIEGNELVDDNVDGDYDFATHDTETTGILVAAGAPPGAVLPPELVPGQITGTVIRGNRLFDVKVGIWTLGVEKSSTQIVGNLFGPGVTPVSEN
jgi:nitrous oxidase accessory protein NosD